MDKVAVRISATMGLLGVAFGAFGAHALKNVLTEHGTTAIWEKAVLYHLVHAVVLFVLGARVPFHRGPWYCFLVGIIVFSGSLYVLAYTNVRGFRAVTPIGGVSFIAGWLWLIVRPSPGTAGKIKA